MNIYDLLITNLGMWLAIANQTLGYWMTVPANATGPLDPSITLTSAGQGVVGDIAFAAIQISQALAEFVVTLFG
jgi:hypothetical protein